MHKYVNIRDTRKRNTLELFSAESADRLLCAYIFDNSRRLIPVPCGGSLSGDVCIKAEMRKCNVAISSASSSSSRATAPSFGTGASNAWQDHRRPQN